MKFPKLLYTTILLLFTQYATLCAQVISAPRLTSTLGNASTITYCSSSTITFTASGDVGSTALEYEFIIERGGTIIYPNGLGRQSVPTFSTNLLQDGDIVFARVWTYDNGGGNALTNSITINVDSPPGVISLNSNVANNSICNDMDVEFSASSASTTTLFEFFINGISIQGPSAQATMTHLISNSSTVTLLAYDNSCNSSIDLFIQENILVPGSIIGGGQYCYGDTPSMINSINSATHNGNTLGGLTPNAFYQWQSSFDGINWSNILGAQAINFTPPALNQTTYFRRTVQYSFLGSNCEAVSNQLLFEVLPQLKSGYIEQANQFFCLGDTLPTLTVTNSTELGNIQYQWQQSTNAGANFTNINLEVSKTFTPANLTTTTLFRRAIFSTRGSSCVTMTSPIQFTYVDLDPGSLDSSQNTNICYNETPPVILNGALGSEAKSNLGTLTYAWQQSIDNVNWSLIPGANQSSYNPPALQNSTYFRRVAINRQGSFSCSSTTNAILISVYDEVISGNVLSDQIICEGDFPNPLDLSGITSSGAGISYQWEMSSDNVNFSTIPNTLSTLSFPVNASWYPQSTTYYRAIVRSSSSPGCDAISNVAKIFVAPTANVVQLSGPALQQNICPGSAISPATFSLTGSATTLSVSGIAGTGLLFTGPVNGVYTLSGTPTIDTAITITANGIKPCTDASYYYNVFITSSPSRPDFIRRNTNTEINSIFQDNGLWYNNTFCQNTAGPTTTAFFPFELSNTFGLINYEWSVVPNTAGTIDPTTGIMTWSPAFSGTATISVRALGCAGNSNWLDTRVEVIPDVIPNVIASALSPPQALNIHLGSGQTGVAPMCQITSSTPDTQFFSTTANGISDYQSIRWSIENIVVGGGVTGQSNPGTINPNTGVMNWNPDFYGSVDIKAEAINCNGNIDASSITTIQILANDDIMPNVITVSPSIIPDCPPQGNYITNLLSNRVVNWSIDNSNAGVIVSTATNTANVLWKDDFSGTAHISASVSGFCATGERELFVMIPGPAGIGTLPGLDDVQLCEGDRLQGIPYTITGFPSTANVSGLPNGITGTLSATYHMVDIEYVGTPAQGQVYQLEILGQLYEYTTQVGDTTDDIVIGLANSITNLPNSNFIATHQSLNTLRLQPKVAGVTLRGGIFMIPGFVTVNINTVSLPQREFILSGTLRNAATGQYNYVITTIGGAPFCQQKSITGKITVVGTSSLTLDTGSTDEQIVCDFSQITPISYSINNANGAIVSGLPPGVTYIASSTQVVISGTPQLNTTTNTVYSYTVSTTNNISGCFPEAAKTGTITIAPNHQIALTSALGSDNQSLCYINNGFGSITPIEYSFGGGATQPPTISGNLPIGIVPSFDAVNNTFTISGTPTTAVTTRTVFNYGLNTAGPNCSSVTLSGTIILNPGPTINPIGSANDQAVCDFGMINPVNFTIDNANYVEVTGLPNGVNYIANSTQVTISGSPQLNTVTTTVYTYSVRAVRFGVNCSPEVTRTGTITIEPNHQIALTSTLGSDNQTICNSGSVGNLNPIVYTLIGGATGAPLVSGLPVGVTSNYDRTNNTLTLSGAPTTSVATTTVYNYGVTTTGPNCNSITVSGTITVKPNPRINLLSSASTVDQTGSFAVCNNSSIQPIRYELFESASFRITGLPNGVSASQSGNYVILEGTPNLTISTRQTYTYTLTSDGSTCQPEVSVTGQIEIIPAPQIDTNFINLNDVTHVQCSGSNDGAIRIPPDSPNLDLRIQGGQSPSAQIEEISLLNPPLLGDEYRITINGIDYIHTVIASSFGGPVQTLTEVRDALVNTINMATGANESVVTASANSISSIRLTADVAGTGFTLNTNLQTSSTGANIPTMTTNQIIANVSTNYIYLWTGPNGFSSSNLEIDNLSAGDYTLRVTAGSCFSEATFTINSPPAITANNELCNGSFKTTLSGGTAPYALSLYDAFGNLVHTSVTNSIFTYTNLVVGANYRLEVRDATCNIPQQFSINIPFELQFNAANVVLTHDYCHQTPNTGEGSIVLGTLSGNAFTGGSGNFSYQWTGPSGNFITKDIYNLVAGDYTVTVTDNVLGCKQSETFTIASNNPLTIALSGTTVLNRNGEIELDCADTASQTIEVNVTGGFGVYTYAWEKNGVAIPNSNVNRLDNLSEGVYTLTVTDIPPGGVILSNICQLSQEFVIVSPAELAITIDEQNIQQAQCPGQLVDIPVEISGGVPPYTLQLNNVIVSTSSPTYVFTDLNPQVLGATVTITLSDQNNCRAEPVSTTLQQYKSYNFTSTTTAIDCRQNTLGAIQLTTDTAVSTDTKLIVEWFGDTLHYFDTWDNGKGLLDQINNPGTYTVSVTNETGCVLYTSSFDINDISGQSLQVEVAQEISSTRCNQNEGRIDLAISNGYPPYTIQWQIQSDLTTWTLLPQYNNQAIITGLSSGSYRAIVSDSSALGTDTIGCGPAITTRTIELNDQRLQLDDLQIKNTVDSCGNTTSAKITFGLINTIQSVGTSNTISPTFMLDGSRITTVTFDVLNQRYQIEDILPGLHQLVISASTVSSTCELSHEFTIDVIPDRNDSPPQLSFVGTTTAIDCRQNRLGAIQLTPNTLVSSDTVLTLEWFGDTLHYFDTWNNGKGLLDQINNPGTYTVSVTSQTGCLLYSSSFEIEDKSGQQLQVEIAQEISSSSCNQDQGRIDLVISNGHPPYTIQWEIQSNTNSWTLLPQFDNFSIINGLSSGTYRAIVSDSNAQGTNTIDCSPTIITRPVVLTNQELSISNLHTEDTTDLCGEMPTGLVRFELIHSFQTTASSGPLSLTFTLDGNPVSQTNGPLRFDAQNQTYQIIDLAPGLHQLEVNASTASASCQIKEEFTINAKANPIQFLGQLDYVINVCDQGADIVVNTNDIVGGKAFSGPSPYALEWKLHPNTITGGTTQTFFGQRLSQAQAGTYELSITDANGCQNNAKEPILIQVSSPGVLPISVQGTLNNPQSGQASSVKVLPIQCDSDQGGIIGIDVLGGYRPFEINWFKQNIDATSAAFTTLPNHKNKTYLSGLEPANYKLVIQSLNENCGGQASPYIFHEEIITVESNPDLYFVSGPFIDADICAGKPGRIAVEIFDNNQGELFFYYDGKQVQKENNTQVNEQTHTLLIDSPKETATLKIVNEQGCSLTKELNLSLGEPKFTFTSASLESSNLILARETIEFENISTDPYVKSEWDFGDFNPPVTVLNIVTSTQVNYSYPVSGAFNVTLRIYNQAGCYAETTQRVAVGKGYSIMLPNVFSPNNDTINDLFRPLTTGLSTIRFSVYDQNGNLIYNENISEPDPTTSTGISIQGWDGRNAPKSPYFIYTVEGLLFDGVTTVEKIGTFLLLR